MSKSLSWVFPYAAAIFSALLAGPLLSAVPGVQILSIPLIALNGSDAARLTGDALAIWLMIALAVRARKELPDNDRGSGFFLTVLFPLTTFIVVLFAGKALRTSGLPLIRQIGQSNFLWTYVIALFSTGLWLTIAWLRHFDLLNNAFSPPAPAKRRSYATRSREEPDSTNISPESAPPAKETVSTSIGHGRHPFTLGRYKILKELGRGAMGLVYLGKDPKIQRFVAIKTMRLDHMKEDDKLQDVRSRFFREAESAGRLSHPNIVTIYDAGEQDDLGYIAMEFVEGQSLKEWSRKPNLLPIEDVVQFLATVGDALDYAHQQGVVHRDIKPANIMVTNDRLVKVMDFGIAKTVSSNKTQTDVVLGTPTYMSPEQIAGKTVDGRSDIFSLGIVLFELLTGQPPFAANNISALLFAIAHHPHPELKSLRRDLPPMVEEVVNRALQKELPKRYRRGGEFAKDLRASLHILAA